MARLRVVAKRRVENSLDIKGSCQGLNFPNYVRVLNAWFLLQN